MTSLFLHTGGFESFIAYMQEIHYQNLREALNSALFTALRSGDLLADDHKGGCVLYEKREQVQALLK